MMIDRVVLEEAAILTAIGISTAFALLVTLMALAVIVRLVAEIMEKCAIRMSMSKAAKEEAKSLDFFPGEPTSFYLLLARAENLYNE